jgi:D-lactate dehydrogenase
MKILVYSVKSFEIAYLKKANNNRHKITFINVSLSSETAFMAMNFEAISIFSADIASEIVLEKLKDFGVKYISLRSAGYDNVNLHAAKRMGIRVANVPAYSPFAIAEHAVSLLLSLNRKLILANNRVKEFNFNLDNLIGFDLNNKTVGIVGTGKIGAIMAKIMNGFGCKLLGYDIVENQELIQEYQMNYVPIKELCKKADIISIHLPLNSKTHYLIDNSLIDEMKEGVIIINTARGAIINTAHIIKGLESHKIGALGIDVYEKEQGVFFRDNCFDIPHDQMLIKLNVMPNVLITGHQAFLTDEALTNIADTTIYNWNRWEEIKESENELTNLV